MKPLLYVCVRPQHEAASAEYESFRSSARLQPAELDRIDLVRDRLPADVFDRFRGFFVGGSPYNVTDPESSTPEVQRALEADLETIAGRAAAGETSAMFTCFGIGVVTRMLGGRVSRAFPEETGPVVVRLTDEGRADRLIGGMADRFAALAAHKEGSATAPPGATLLATNTACPVQAYSVGAHLYATQFHPEPTTRAFTERMVFYRNDGYFNAREFDEVAGRVLAASVTEPARLLQAFAQSAGVAPAVA